MHTCEVASPRPPEKISLKINEIKRPYAYPGYKIECKEINVHQESYEGTGKITYGLRLSSGDTRAPFHIFMQLQSIEDLDKI